MTAVMSMVWLISCCIVLEHGMVRAVPRSLTVSGNTRLLGNQNKGSAVVAARMSRGGGEGKGGGHFGITGNNNHFEDASMMMLPPTHSKNIWSGLKRLTKVSRRLHAFFHSLFTEHCPQVVRGMIACNKNNSFKHQVMVVFVGSFAAGLCCDYFMIQRKEKQLIHLIWDAKELIPDVWDAVELVLNETSTGLETTHTAYIKGLRNRADLQDLLLTKLNKAKALQVAGIYQKHFPNQWKKLVASNSSNNKKNKDNNIMSCLAKRQRLLGKLTRNIAQQKFTALLRPDYMFGIGRNGIDLSKDFTGNGMVDLVLLQQVTEDLVVNVPKDYPEIWNFYTSKLYPGQTLYDRHDLVLKIVKNVQMQKQSKDSADGTSKVKSFSSSSISWGTKEVNGAMAGEDENNDNSVDDTFGRDQHSTSTQVSSN
jgi:hypothetical protein